MLVIHVHIIGKHGSVERTYDFLRNDGKEHLDGVDCTIPYSEENHYPISEHEAVAIISTKHFRGDH